MPALTPSQWQALLRAHGYRDLDDAVRATVAAGGAHRQLAQRLGVSVGELERRFAEVERARKRLEGADLRGRSAGMYREKPERRGTVETDGRKVRCEACGGWYRSVGSHVRVHGMTAEQYREEYDLPEDALLVGDDVHERQREIGLEQSADGGFAGLPPGPELDAFRAKSQQQRKDAARDYWQEKLERQGWQSWREALDWAEADGSGWRGIAARLDVTHQSARTAAGPASRGTSSSTMTDASNATCADCGCVR